MISVRLFLRRSLSWLSGLILLGITGLLSLGFFACGETVVREPVRLIMTPFKYAGFGSSTESALVVVEVVGTFSGERCLFMEIRNTSVQNVEISRFQTNPEGNQISEDQSVFIIDRFDKCKQDNVSCVPGLITKKIREFVVQVDFYGAQGGLLFATLYNRNCEQEGDVVDETSIPVGNLTPPPPPTNPSENTDSESTADGGSGE